MSQVSEAHPPYSCIEMAAVHLTRREGITDTDRLAGWQHGAGRCVVQEAQTKPKP